MRKLFSPLLANPNTLLSSHRPRRFCPFSAYNKRKAFEEEERERPSAAVISVDAMGGDLGPAAIVAGIAKSASRNPDVHFLVFGPEPELREHIEKRRLADRCEIQVSYAIGVAEPTSISVRTFGTGKLSDTKLTELIRYHFDLTPYGILTMLDLIQPIYKATAAYGHFGRGHFSWEQTDKAELLRNA